MIKIIVVVILIVCVIYGLHMTDVINGITDTLHSLLGLD